jgi:branched-chain amino acid transport system permease protein
VGVIRAGAIKMNANKVWTPVALVVLLLMPVLTGHNDYLMHFLVLCFIWGVVAEAWNLIVGYAGIFSFGQIAFFTLGAFGSAILSIHLGLPVWLAMLAAGVFAGLVGLLIGLPCLRLRGEYIALITYALHMLLTPLIFRGEPIGIEPGGFMWNIPAFSFFGYTFPRDSVLPWYYVGLVLFILFLLLIYRIIHSPIGRAFVALRDAEPLAQSLGVDEYKYKLIVFISSAFITGVMGAFYAHYAETISVRILGLDYFIKALIMMVIGGLGGFPGAAIGAFLITIVYEYMRPLGKYRLIILGVLVILTVVYMPKGLIETPTYLRRLKRWKVSGPDGVDSAST